MPGADVGGLLRSGVASLCLAAGVLHVSAAADHRGMAGHVAFFLVVASLQSALGAAVLLARPGRWLAVATAVNLAAALVWTFSRTTGLPVDGSPVPEAIGFKDGITTMIEIGAAAGAGLWWLLPDGARRVVLPSGRLATTLLGTGVWAVGAAGLFAGHTHSPGHTHAAQHARATSAASADAHPHSGESGHHDDHARRAGDDGSTAVSGDGASGDGAHDHANASHGAAHHLAGHRHGAESQAPALRTPAAGAHDHDPRHHHDAAQPVPGHAAGHHHDQVATAPAQDGPGHGGEGHGHRHDGGAGGDHRHPADDHNHEDNGSGRGRGDEDGGASPLEDVLKLIQPR
ncbi:MAG TPA: hypothetical protein VJS45_12495 [Acidimicrobiia bacterium]|nr:hypothetical protein [Acidimicrobiia bacterium]